MKMGTSSSFAEVLVPSSPSTNNYLTIYGVQEESNVIINEFELVPAALQNHGTLNMYQDKKFYIGALRTDYSGSLVFPTECLYSYFRVYLEGLEYDTIKDHARDPFNYGSNYSYRNLYNGSSLIQNEFNYSAKSLALNWDFENTGLTASAGTASIEDFTSGSDIGYTNWYNDLGSRNYIGTGYGFNTTASVIQKGYASVARNRNLDDIHGIDTVQLIDDEYFGINQTPKNYFYSIENSPNAVISEEILHMFSSIDEFSNLVGEPVHQFRYNYKGMEKLREIFFSKVKNSKIDVERYFEYFKWIDFALNSIVSRLYPASANSSEEIFNIIESHVLERNKYKYPYHLIKGRPQTHVGWVKSENDGATPNNAQNTGEQWASGSMPKPRKSYKAVGNWVKEYTNITASSYNPIYHGFNNK